MNICVCVCEQTFTPPKTFEEVISALLNQHPLEISFIFMVMSVLRIAFLQNVKKKMHDFPYCALSP